MIVATKADVGRKVTIRPAHSFDEVEAGRGATIAGPSLDTIHRDVPVVLDRDPRKRRQLVPARNLEFR